MKQKTKLIFTKNYNLTKKISELGYLKVINEHTYEKRFLEIYKKIKLFNKMKFSVIHFFI